MLLFNVFRRFKSPGFTPLSIIILSLILSLSGSFTAFGAEIKLAWDPNTEPDLAGYRVYYGVASGSYGPPVSVGNVTSHTLSGLTQGQTYFITVSALDTSNNESGHSNEVNGAAADPTQSYNITTDIPGLQITVDGATYSSPQIFTWTPGSSHAISVSSPQSGGTGTQYVFSSWSDGGSQNHTITAPSSASTYTASFTAQYSLTTSASPTGGGTVTPSGVNWYNSGQDVSISASSNPGYSFLTWTGDLSGSTNPASITMNGPKNVTANFGTPITPLFNPSPGVLVISPLTPLSALGTEGGPFNPSSQSYVLENKGGLAVNWVVSKTQNWVALSSTKGNLNPGATATVTVSIDKSANRLSVGSYSDAITFVNATNGNGNASRSVGLTVSPVPPTYTVTTNVSSLQVNVDDSVYSTTQSFQWVAGSSHKLYAPSPQDFNNGSRYKFVSWSDGGGQTHNVIASGVGTTYVANYAKENKIKVTVFPSEAGAVTVSNSELSNSGVVSGASSSGTGYDDVSMVTRLTTEGAFIRGGAPSDTFWLNQGQKVTLKAIPNKGFHFLNWSGDLPESSNPLNFDAGKPISVVANFVDMKGKTVDESSGFADISKSRLPMIGALESPSEGKRVLGLKTIYGWALDGEGILKVKLYIDDKFVCDIPYGGLTEGLKEVYPNYPDADRGGFALVWNFSSLPPGIHLVQVDVQNSKGEVLNLGANVFVQNISGEMVSQNNTQELFISGIKLAVNGIINSYDLRVEWSPESDAFEIIDFLQ